MKERQIEEFNPKAEIKNPEIADRAHHVFKLTIGNDHYNWRNNIEKVNIIRQGIPYIAIDVFAEKISVPIKETLNWLEIPQTTYNKKKKTNQLLNNRQSEMILTLTEVLDFGLMVFNHENAKFLRWIKKPNTSLGGVTPESLFDSIAGLQEVKNALDRLEYGNMA